MTALSNVWRPATGSYTVSNHEGWRLYLLENDQASAIAKDLIALAREAASGRMGKPYHRSHHATTWRAPLGSPIALPVFVKLIEHPRGFARIKQIIRGSRAAHVVRITQALSDAGFSVPPILLRGTHLERGELLITACAEGDGPRRTLARLASGPLANKWMFLRGLGREIARLHRCGFVHGDLTPFNLFVIRGEPPRFALIDHERTRRVSRLAGSRTRLRNFVQLGRFALPGISRADRLRLLRGYTEMMSPAERRALMRRAAAMLDRRIRRDHGLAAMPSQPAKPPHKRHPGPR